MKKFLVFFLALTMMAGFAAAQEEGLGLAAGVELGFPDLTGDGDFQFNVTPFLEYENSFDDVDLYGKLEVELGVAGYGDDMPVALNFEFEPGYNLGLSDVSSLYLGLNGILDYQIAPDMDDAFGFELTPIVRFTQTMGFGDFFAELAFPIGIVHQFVPNDFDDLSLGLDPTLGVATDFGFGAELTPHLMFLPDGVDLYDGLDLLLLYETGPFYAELNVNIPSEMGFGLTLSPYCEYSFDPMAVYLGIDIGGIGADGGDVGIDLYLGFKYSF